MTVRPYDVLLFGETRDPVVVIDDYAPDAEALLQAARAAPYGGAGQHYPGQRAAAPPGYLKTRGDVLGAVLSDVFGIDAGADLIECNYSVVTTPEDALTPIQRLPHFDSTSPKRLALLHYLCPAEMGGTAFYRHRATGFEQISADRLAAYDAALKREINRDGLPPPAYFTGSNLRFEQIGQVGAAFNRMVIYRGWRLHSGVILEPDRIGGPIEEARVTINTFLEGR